MFKALMVLCKVTMAAPGGEEAAQGCSWKEELWGTLLQVYPEVFVSFGGLFCPELCKGMPVHPLCYSPGSCYRCRCYGEFQGPMAAHLGFFVSFFIAFDACMPRDPFHMHPAFLYAWCSDAVWPCLGSLLETPEY